LVGGGGPGRAFFAGTALLSFCEGPAQGGGCLSGGWRPHCERLDGLEILGGFRKSPGGKPFFRGPASGQQHRLPQAPHGLDREPTTGHRNTIEFLRFGRGREGRCVGGESFRPGGEGGGAKNQWRNEGGAAERSPRGWGRAHRRGNLQKQR